MKTKKFVLIITDWEQGPNYGKEFEGGRSTTEAGAWAIWRRKYYNAPHYYGGDVKGI